MNYRGIDNPNNPHSVASLERFRLLTGTFRISPGPKLSPSIPVEIRKEIDGMPRGERRRVLRGNLERLFKRRYR